MYGRRKYDQAQPFPSERPGFTGEPQPESSPSLRYW